MEKELFIDVLKHYSKSSENEALTIISLKESFPFSQVLRILAARVSKDHNLEGQNHLLQQAAVYAADRGILKAALGEEPLIAAPPPRDLTPNGMSSFKASKETYQSRQAEVGSVSFKAERKEEPTPSPVVEEPVSHPAETPTAGVVKDLNTQETKAISIEEPDVQVVPIADPVSADVGESSVADQVMSDLERLNELKQNFEALFTAQQATRKLENLKNSNPVVETIQSEEDPTTHKSKRERIIELAKARDAEQKVEETVTTERKSPLNRNVSKTIIDEIANSKQEIEPESQKQKEQIRMIDQFIKTQPSISNSKEKMITVPEGDLATIKTGDFTDNIVSETLVEILLKQGKKDKAIEVLKKLIWKFPQKKAYFAAQIEDLKK